MDFVLLLSLIRFMANLNNNPYYLPLNFSFINFFVLIIDEMGGSSFGTAGNFRRLFLPSVSNDTFFVSKSKYPNVFNVMHSFVDVADGCVVVVVVVVIGAPIGKPNDLDTLLATNDSFFCARIVLTFETDEFLYGLIMFAAVLVTVFGRYDVTAVDDDVILVFGLILRADILGEPDIVVVVVVVVIDDGRFVWPY